MARNIGEELVGAWLGVIEECDFVQYNVQTRENQGEIDVVGLTVAQFQSCVFVLPLGMVH